MCARDLIIACQRMEKEARDIRGGGEHANATKDKATCYRCGEAGHFIGSCKIKREDAKCSWKGCKFPDGHLEAACQGKKTQAKEGKGKGGK